MSKTTRSIGYWIGTAIRPARAASAAVLLGAIFLPACDPAGGVTEADAGVVSTPDSPPAKEDAGSAGDASGPSVPSDARVALPQANATCTVGAQCASGFCVDGVCCDNACGGSCESCALTGKVGTCSPITNATDDGCHGDSICDGSGACRKLLGRACVSPSECATGNCVDGVCCGSAACGPCQSCAMPGLEGTCAVVAKFTDDGDSGCSGERTCDGLGMCRFQNGTGCAANDQCTSLHCADGVCCNEACNGTCFGCDQPGRAGTCSPIDGAPDDSSGVPCNGSSICTAPAGATPACKVKDGEPCTSNADCLNGSCITSYRDGDHDGFGRDKMSRCERVPAAGYVLTGGDCCDSDAATHPGVTSYAAVANACGGFDLNCDGKVERQNGTTTMCGCISEPGKLGNAVCIACR